MNAESRRCCHAAGTQRPIAHAPVATAEPMLLSGASPTSDEIIGRMSGQKRIAHRGSVLAPWLQPSSTTRRPLRAWIRRTASTTYSAATWMSPLVCSGSVTSQAGMPCAVSTLR